MLRLKIIGAATFACLATLVLAPKSAMADDYFGAIAFSQQSGSHGYAYDYDSRETAEREAMEQCGESSCAIVVWFKNACAALAVGTGNGYGYGWAADRAEAESTALSNCRSNSQGCSIDRWVCTTR